MTLQYSTGAHLTMKRANQRPLACTRETGVREGSGASHLALLLAQASGIARDTPTFGLFSSCLSRSFAWYLTQRLGAYASRSKSS